MDHEHRQPLGGEKTPIPQTASLKERLHHFTWAWFTLTMSTGGIALLLASTPHRFRGLTTIGTIIFILDLVLFALLTCVITTRFLLFRGSFTAALNHPTESLFIPTFWLSVATLITNIQRYAYPSTGPWILPTLRILFWLYLTLSFLSAITQYHILFTGKPLTLQSMTPAWLLPMFPVMLTGTVASVIASSQPTHQAIPIIVAGTTFQGLGWLVAMFMYANYIGRLMTSGLPSPNTRPGMFIAVGPPSFTALALIGMANAALIHFPNNYIVGTTVPAAQVLKIVAVFCGIFLWSVSLFFFCVSAAAVVAGAKQLKFHLTWWSFVFPNTGSIIAAIQIGTAIGSQAVLWVTSGLTCLQVAIWVFVAGAHVRAVYKGQILWPGRDEDRDE